MQWTGPRRKKYEAYCKNNNLDPAADETNYKYLVLETKSDEAHSLQQLKKTTTVETATETFMAQNLRPGIPHLENRKQWAAKAYEATKEAAPATTGVVVGGGGAVIAMSQTEPKYWIWLLFAAIAVGGFAYLIHKRQQVHKADEMPVAVIVPKSNRKKNKNGKES